MLFQEQELTNFCIMSVARLFGPHCTSGSRSVSQSATFCDSFFCPITKKSARHQTSGLCLRHLCNGAEGESRTPTPLRELDPEPSVSTNSTTSARKRLLHVLAPFGKSFFEGLKKKSVSRSTRGTFLPDSVTGQELSPGHCPGPSPRTSRIFGRKGDSVFRKSDSEHCSANEKVRLSSD